MNNNHIEDEDLEGYSSRVCSEESATRVELHLLVCDSCRQRLVEADDYRIAMKNAARGLRAEGSADHGRPWIFKWSWTFPRLAPALAALVVAVIAVVALPEIRRGTPAPVAVSLRTMRGAASQNAAPSRHPLLLELDLTGLAASPSYRVEMVDRAGDPVWQGACDSHGSTGSVTVPPQERGTYFVRVALPSGETLREYGLELRGTD